jgi:hypothetical protein
MLDHACAVARRCTRTELQARPGLSMIGVTARIGTPQDRRALAIRLPAALKYANRPPLSAQIRPKRRLKARLIVRPVKSN